jgi:hypothetical protein
MAGQAAATYLAMMRVLGSSVLLNPTAAARSQTMGGSGTVTSLCFRPHPARGLRLVVPNQEVVAYPGKYSPVQASSQNALASTRLEACLRNNAGQDRRVALGPSTAAPDQGEPVRVLQRYMARYSLQAPKHQLSFEASVF